MIFEGKVEPCYNNCPYCVRTSYDWDTGYEECGCTFGNADPKNVQCYEEDCPLKCKWRVEE
jgi:hypothetical protein